MHSHVVAPISGVERARRGPALRRAGIVVLIALMAALLSVVVLGEAAASGAELPTVLTYHSPWTAEPVPSAVSTVEAVSCPTPTYCVSVGDNPEGSGSEFMTSVNGGVTWVAQSAAVGSFFNALSCASTAVCTAVGESTTGTPVGFNTVNGGSTWTSQPVPPYAGELTGISCATTSTCVVVGRTLTGSPTLSITTDGGAAWTAESVPIDGSYIRYLCVILPTPHCIDEGVTLIAVTQLNGVSCPTATNCELVGFNSLDEGALLASINGGVSWGSQTAPSGIGALQAVSCASATDCEATTSASTTAPAIIGTTNGSTWTTQTTPSVGNPYDLDAISCASASVCDAVGMISPAGSEGIGINLVTTNGGSTWSQVFLVSGPLLTISAAVPPEASLLGVSCTGPDCVTVGIDTSSPGAILTSGPPAAWSQQSPGTSPPAGSSGAMAFDPTTGQLVLFSGASGTYGQTWTWNGSTWANAEPSCSSATCPPARSGADLAFDTATNQLVLFGGAGAGGDLNDTWTWNGSTWARADTSCTATSPITACPEIRTGAAMAYDPASGQLLLFGGQNDAAFPAVILADTWSWTGSAWSELSPAQSPPQLFGSSLAFDGETGQLILVGGEGPQPNIPFPELGYSNATFAWNGTSWSNPEPSCASNPTNCVPAAVGGAAAYDSATGQLLLFGGQLSDGNLLSNLNSWNGALWSNLAPSPSPTARDGAAMAYDPTTGQLVLFGGQGSSGTLDDTWAWSQ